MFDILSTHKVRIKPIFNLSFFLHNNLVRISSYLTIKGSELMVCAENDTSKFVFWRPLPNILVVCISENFVRAQNILYLVTTYLSIKESCNKLVASTHDCLIPLPVHAMHSDVSSMVSDWGTPCDASYYCQSSFAI